MEYRPDDDDRIRIGKRRRFIINFVYFVIIFGLSILAVRYALPALLPFVVALLVALLLRPLVNLLSDKLTINRRAVSLVLVLLFYATIGVAVLLLVLKLANTLGNLISKLPSMFSANIYPALSDAISSIEKFITDIDTDGSMNIDVEATLNAGLSSVSSAVSELSKSAVSWTTKIALGVPNIMLNVLITVIATIFMLMDFDLIFRFFRAQLPEKHNRLLHTMSGHLGHVVRKYLVSYAIIMLITFCELMIGLTIIRVEGPVGLAALIAVFDILPVVGSGTVIVPWAVVSLLTGGIGRAVGLFIIWAIMVVVRNIIEPKIVGSSVGMHPLMTLFAMLLGSFIYGGIGILLLPVALAVCQSLNQAGIIHIYNPVKAEEPREGKLERTLSNVLDKICSAIVRLMKNHVFPFFKKTGKLIWKWLKALWSLICGLFARLRDRIRGGSGKKKGPPPKNGGKPKAPSGSDRAAGPGSRGTPGNAGQVPQRQAPGNNGRNTPPPGSPRNVNGGRNGNENGNANGNGNVNGGSRGGGQPK